MGTFSKKHARRGDPSTSHKAANEIENSAKQIKAIVLSALKRHGAMTSEEIAEATGLTHPQVWRRTSDLKNEFSIIDSGQRRLNTSGKDAIVWRVMKDDEKPTEQDLWSIQE